MADVKITGLHKRFGAVHAVRGIDLDIPDGEFTVLVGPSGCGKSTLLRTIAGLEDADEGTIEIGGEVVNDVRPRDRDVAMVFQDYALYPHMTVAQEHRLRPEGAEVPEGRDRDARQRAPRRCSASPSCSTAIRASSPAASASASRSAAPSCAIRSSSCSTSRSPTSTPSFATRCAARSSGCTRRSRTTMIYVTHDQIEAMTLADRIVLMRDGVIEQQGAPLDLFERPATRFVAGFLGSPKMNFLPGRLVRSGGDAAVRLDGDDEVDAGPARRPPAERRCRRHAGHRSASGPSISRAPPRARRARGSTRRRRRDRAAAADRLAHLRHLPARRRSR